MPKTEATAQYNDYVGTALAPSGYVAGDGDFANPEPAIGHQWKVADILQAMIDADLRLRVVREYPHTNGCEVFEGMKPLEGRRYTVPDGAPAMPLMLGLVAQKPPA